jgi:hypothetical protein
MAYEGCSTERPLFNKGQQKWRIFFYFKILYPKPGTRIAGIVIKGSVAMKRNKILVLALLGLVATGCGASKAQKKDASPTPELENSNTVKVKSPTSPHVGAASSSNSNARPTMRGRRERVDIDPSATPLPLTFEKAGENSEFAIWMDQEGSVSEMRVFSNHKQIQKAELKWLDAKVRSIKVLLKNGKTAEVKTDKVTSIRKMSSSDLLSLVGIKITPKAAQRPHVSPER